MVSSDTRVGPLRMRLERFVLLLFCLSLVEHTTGQIVDSILNTVAPSSTARILRSKGYHAEDHYIDVQGGRYTLNLVKVSPPSVRNGIFGYPRRSSNRDPILFVHGILTNANSFFYINEGVTPRDYTGYDINKMTTDQLYELLKDDPGRKSLVFTALHFGFECWLLNRRQTLASRIGHKARRLTGGIRQPGASNETLSSDDDNETQELGDFTPSRADNEQDKLFNFGGLLEDLKYWNFSIDEQAYFDLPSCIDYILEESQKEKLITVTYSMGTTIQLMTFAARPEYAAKVSQALLYAPFFDIGNGYMGFPNDEFLTKGLPVMSQIIAPFPPQFVTPIVDLYTQTTCSSALLRPLFCDALLDFLLGKGSSQLESQYLSIANSWSEPSSVRALAQDVQSLNLGRMHHFDYMNDIENLAVYGQKKPPIWDISRITSTNMTFFVGNTDIVASVSNYQLTKERLTVPVREFIIQGDGVLFNHFGFVLHKDIDKYLIMPSIKIIGTT